MVQYRVIDEYKNGWMAVRGEEECFARTPSGKEISFGSSARVFNTRRVRLYVALCVRLGELPLLENRDVVPVSVAVAGKPEIVAYLYANNYRDILDERSERPDEEWSHPVRVFATQAGISHRTVSKYCSRVVREVQDRRVYPSSIR